MLCIIIITLNKQLLHADLWSIWYFPVLYQLYESSTFLITPLFSLTEQSISLQKAASAYTLIQPHVYMYM